MEVFHRTIVYSFWLWTSEFGDRLKRFPDIPEGRLVAAIREAVANLKLRPGGLREREEAILNSVRHFYFPMAPSSFVASFRPFFEQGGPSLTSVWFSHYSFLRKRKSPEEGTSAEIKDMTESLVSGPDLTPLRGPGESGKKAVSVKPSTGAGSPSKARPKKSPLLPESLDVGIARPIPPVKNRAAVSSPSVVGDAKKSLKKEVVSKTEVKPLPKRELVSEFKEEVPLSRTSLPTIAQLRDLKSVSGDEGGRNPPGSLSRGVFLSKDRRVPSAEGAARSSSVPSPPGSVVARENAGGSPIGALLNEASLQARNLRATRRSSQEVPEGSSPWVPRDIAGVFGDFVAESNRAADCYVLFSVPDVDIRGNQLSSRDDLDYLGPPNAESVWVRKVSNESCSTLCTGCMTYMRWKMGIVQASAPFWRELRNAWEHHRDASKVNDVVFFDNEADWRCRRVPEVLHTCSLRCSYGPPPRRFAWSKGSTQKRGLNGHGLQMRLRVGVVCPYIRAQYSYNSVFRLECYLPLWGVARYYWGSHLRVEGSLRCQWEFKGQGSNRPKFSFRLAGSHLNYFRTGGAVGDLKLCPVEVQMEPRFGPRPDVQVVYAQLCWVGTVFPPCVNSVVPNLYVG